MIVRAPPSVPCCVFNRPNPGAPGPKQMPGLGGCDESGKILGAQCQGGGVSCRAGRPAISILRHRRGFRKKEFSGRLEGIRPC